MCFRLKMMFSTTLFLFVSWCRSVCWVNTKWLISTRVLTHHSKLLWLFAACSSLPLERARDDLSTLFYLHLPGHVQVPRWTSCVPFKINWTLDSSPVYIMLYLLLNSVCNLWQFANMRWTSLCADTQQDGRWG